RQRSRVNEDDSFEELIVANVHPFLDRPCHTGKADAELCIQLLAYGSHAAVAEVVDIVDHCRGVDQADEIFYNKDDIFLSEDALVIAQVETEFLVDPVSADFTEVVSFLAEEQALDDI